MESADFPGAASGCDKSHDSGESAGDGGRWWYINSWALAWENKQVEATGEINKERPSVELLVYETMQNMSYRKKSICVPYATNMFKMHIMHMISYAKRAAPTQEACLCYS